MASASKPKTENEWFSVQTVGFGVTRCRVDALPGLGGSRQAADPALSRALAVEPLRQPDIDRIDQRGERLRIRSRHAVAERVQRARIELRQRLEQIERLLSERQRIFVEQRQRAGDTPTGSGCGSNHVRIVRCTARRGGPAFATSGSDIVRNVTTRQSRAQRRGHARRGMAH